jgi:hypothetical protein
MLSRIFTLFLLAGLPAAVAFPASTADIYHRENVCHQDWVYGVMPFVGLCSISNFAWLHCIEDLSKKQLKEVAKNLDGMKTHNKKAELSFAYLPGEKAYAVTLISGKISLDEGQHSISFIFDDKPEYKLIGHVSKETPDGLLDETTYRNSIVFEHKKILREVVPKMKKHSQLEIKINGRDKLPILSLMGFSKAYEDMQDCMGEAVTYDLLDPF